MTLSVEGFFHWLGSFAVDPLLFLVLVLAISDFIRTIGKIIYLLVHELEKKDSFCVLSSAPRASILIPAHNEECCLQQTIESIIATNYHQKEIIVIDHNSADKTYDIAKKYAVEGKIKLISCKCGHTKADALAFGFYHCNGDIIITVDADTLLAPDAICKILSSFEDKKVTAVSGSIQPIQTDYRKDKSILNALQKYEYLLGLDIGRRFASIFDTLVIVSGAFGAFRKNVLLKINPFENDTKGEDFDLTLKVKKLGGKIVFASDSYAKTICPNNWKELARQRIRWSYSQIQVLSKHKEVLLSCKFQRKLVVSFLDMIVMDLVFGLLFAVGVAYLVFLLYFGIIESNWILLESLVYLLFLLFLIYFLSELVLFAYSVFYLKTRNIRQLLILIPIMIFIYRPFLKFSNLSGHTLALLKREIDW